MRSLNSRAPKKPRAAIRRAVVVAICGVAAPALVAGPASAYISPSNTAQWGTDGTVWALTRVGDVVYLGGDFDTAVGPGGASEPRSNLAAIDLTTGQLTDWAPDADGVVYSLAAAGSTIVAGGQFANVGGIARSRIAAVGAGGSVLPWQASADGRVRGLAVSGQVLYAGGSFTNVSDGNDTHRRRRLAALDLSSTPPGEVLPWNPKADRAVRSLTVLGNANVVIGGIFTSVNGVDAQRFVAELRPDGELATWNSHPADAVWSVASAGSQIAVGVGGGSNAIRVYDPSGNLQWSHDGDGDVQAVAFSGGEVLAGGHFGHIADEHIPKLAAFSTSGVLDTSFVPDLNSPKGVWTVLGSTGYVHAGGAFTIAGSDPANHFAQFAAT